jgi:hypothetical protein
MDQLVGIAMGLGLAAACGFRVFVPLLALSLAARGGVVPLASSFQWLGSDAALLALATATVLEVLAYSIPWVDHALDLVATPAAVMAGVLATASVVTDLPPVVRWGVALIGGGSAAGLVQGATVLMRLKSGAFTAGLANPVVSAGELVGAAVLATLALLVPVVCLLLVAVGSVLMFKAAGRVLFGRRARPTG